MASVRKRPWTYKGVTKEKWVVEYTDPATGKRRRFTPKSGLKKDAEKERLRIETEIEGGIHTARSESVLFREAADEFIKDCERRRRIGAITGATLHNRIARTKIAVGKFGPRLLTDIESSMVEDWIEEMRETYKRHSIEAYYSNFALILRFAVKKKWIKRNVLIDDPVALPKYDDSDVVFPSREDLFKLIELLDAPHRNGERGRNDYFRRAVIALGIFAGLRRGEMAGLQWENVDFENNVIRVRHAHTKYDNLKMPKTDAGIRDVPMSSLVKRTLERVWQYWTLRERIERTTVTTQGRRNAYTYKSRKLQEHAAKPFRPDPGDQPLTGYVLRRPKDNGGFAEHEPLGEHAITTVLWKPLMRDAGLVDENDKLKFSTHSLRHAAASLFIESGLPAFNLKSVIGHSSVSTTYDIYGHLFPDDTRVRDAVLDITEKMTSGLARQESANA